MAGDDAQRHICLMCCCLDDSHIYFFGDISDNMHGKFELKAIIAL